MSAEQNWPPPNPPVKVEVHIGGEDWGYVARQLRELADEAERRDPSTFRLFGGGGGGNYHTTVYVRDVTPEKYREELSAWFDGVRAQRPGCRHTWGAIVDGTQTCGACGETRPNEPVYERPEGA